jgi:hypothetical protein
MTATMDQSPMVWRSRSRSFSTRLAPTPRQGLQDDPGHDGNTVGNGKIPSTPEAGNATGPVKGRACGSNVDIMVDLTGQLLNLRPEVALLADSRPAACAWEIVS